MFYKNKIIILSLLLLGLITFLGGNSTFNYNYEQQKDVKFEDIAIRSEKVSCITFTSSNSYTHIIEHEPINIEGNYDLITQADSEGWIGNGSQYNPFIITGLFIDSGSFSIRLEDIDMYIKISECQLTEADTIGILLYEVFNVVIINNTITNTDIGIQLVYSIENTVVNNTLVDNRDYGINLEESSSNIIVNNTISNNQEYGIYLDSSQDNILIGNQLSNCSFYIWDTDEDYNLQKEVSNNLVNGKSLFYLQNMTNSVVPTGVGQIVLVNCTNIEIINQEITKTTGAIIIANCNNIDINNNVLTNNFGSALLLRDSSNCTIFKNNLTYNKKIAIDIYKSNDNLIINNTISYNDADGIYVSQSTGNKIFNNTIDKNDNKGIFLHYSSLNILSNNIFSYNDHYGVALHYSPRNTIHKNDFIENCPKESSQAYDGFHLIGSNNFQYNFWSDWTKPDRNNDSIIDNPYIIEGDSNSKDPFPVAVSYHNVTINPRNSPGFSLLSTLTILIIFGLIKTKK